MRKTFLIFAGLVFWAVGAFAQDSADPTDQCQVDADCPEQFVCRAVEIPCATTACEPCECMAMPCPEDAWDGCGCTCPVCDVQECAGGEYKVCSWEPVECEVDADCPDGFACAVQESCSGGVDCACPSCMCDPASDVCDCPDIICDCGDMTEPECTIDGGWCMPKPVECETDADCVEGFSCVASGGVTSCLCPDCFCEPCLADAECLPCECEECNCDQDVTEGPSYCMPAAWEDYVEFRDGEPAYLAMLEDGNDMVPIPDGDAIGGEIDNQTDDTSSGNCSAGSTGTFPWLVLIPAVLVFAFRRRFN